MTPNKTPSFRHAKIRVATIIKFIHDHKQWSISDIADHAKCSYPTAKRDINDISVVYPIRRVRKWNSRQKMEELYGLWKYHPEIKVKE